MTELPPDAMFPALSVHEPRGVATQALLRFGLPLPAGRFFGPRNIRLIDQQGRTVPAHIDVTALWPDNSMQWVQILCEQPLPAGETVHLGIAENLDRGAGTIRPDAMQVWESDTHLHIDGFGEQLSINTRTFDLFSTGELDGYVELGVQGQRHNVAVNDFSYRRICGSDGTFAVDVSLQGQLTLAEKKRLNLCCDLWVYDGGKRVEGCLALHNPQAARHEEGLWDLGDPQSILLDSASLGLRCNNGVTPHGAVSLLPGDAPQTFNHNLSICQHSSGGRHWDSPVHVDQTNALPFSEPGYVLTIDDVEQRGARANPVVEAWLDAGSSKIAAKIEDFWQRFPTRMAARQGDISLDLLPASSYKHELQAGERLSRQFAFLLTEHDAASLHANPVITLNHAHLMACQLPELGEMSAVEPRLLSIIEEGLKDDVGFFYKREAIDEYGWRNFGDLYADHETDGYSGERPFVSHYNNQYDPLHGFLRQHLLTGKPQWFELANDLARHVVDIDMYHTDDDRPEYNQGLFWHTDHYLPAETATHRSYSKLQPGDAYEGHARGGGPGGQHCYTTGLLHHFLLTGDKTSRAAMRGLAEWIERVYEGGETLVDVLLSLKNRKRRDLKNQLTGIYPLDRGTANYLNALMDCHTLDRASSTLAQIEHVIQNTVHPADDLSVRDLTNVEDNWYYIVFLQALCRYLQLKASLSNYDYAFVYARDTLLHYADWMLENEAPYLHKPEILEFPNHTWTAQDLRKANLFFYAAHWTPDNPQPYLEKGRFFSNYVAETLANEPSRHYTRILALLMQNLHPSLPLEQADVRPTRLSYASQKSIGIARQSINLTRQIARAIWPPKLRKELEAVRRLLPKRKHGESAT